MKPESDTRQRLLETAMDLLWEQSYGAVSVDDICERAGAKKGSFYHFFPSKAELAVAALEDHWEKLRPDLDRIFSSLTPPLERLSVYCDFVYRRQQEKRARFGRVCGCAFTSLASELSTQDENIRHKSQEILARRCRYFSSTIRDAIHEGLVPEQDCDAKAHDLFGSVMGLILQAKIANDLEILRHLKPTMFRLIGAREEALTGEPSLKS